MRIAIITLQLHTNYGGVLQAYALQKTLEGMGHSVSILQNKEILPKPRGFRLLRKLVTRPFRKYVLGHKDVEVFRERRINREFPIVGKEFVRFFNNYLNIRYISSFKEIRPSDYDAFIVGSDQVWRPKYNPQMMHSFLDFTLSRWRNRYGRSWTMKDWNVRRIAYAISFGTDEWEFSRRQWAAAEKLITHFDALSTRELGGAATLAAYFDSYSWTVLDPTMLLTTDDYRRLIGANGKQNDSCNEEGRLPRVFEYILDRSLETESTLAKIQKRYGLLTLPEVGEYDSYYDRDEGIVVDVEPYCSRPVTVNTFLTENPRGKGDISKRIQPSVESWLEGIINSDVIITDSFHACVFAILFHKRFVVIGNGERGVPRLRWLLKQFLFEERLVSKDCENEEIDNLLRIRIDWECVDNALSFNKKYSLRFLTRALSIEK